MTTLQEILDAAQQLSQPDRIRLASQLMQLVAQELQPPEEAKDSPAPQSDDPLVGLFSGSPELATQAEEILQQQPTSTSGFSWKES